MAKSDIDRIIDLAAKDTQRGVRVIAKVFYRSLRKRGFSENQIITIATNILSCLIENIRADEKKMDKVIDHKKEKQKEYTIQY